MYKYIRSSKGRRFRDTENGGIVTLSQLKREYKDLYESGETEAETFEDYLRNCLDQDGFLKEI